MAANMQNYFASSQQQTLEIFILRLKHIAAEISRQFRSEGHTQIWDRLMQLINTHSGRVILPLQMTRHQLEEPLLERVLLRARRKGEVDWRLRWNTEFEMDAPCFDESCLHAYSCKHHTSNGSLKCAENAAAATVFSHCPLPAPARVSNLSATSASFVPASKSTSSAPAPAVARLPACPKPGGADANISAETSPGRSDRFSSPALSSGSSAPDQAASMSPEQLVGANLLKELDCPETPAGPAGRRPISAQRSTPVDRRTPGHTGPLWSWSKLAHEPRPESDPQLREGSIAEGRPGRTAPPPPFWAQVEARLDECGRPQRGCDLGFGDAFLMASSRRVSAMRFA